jgi:hypothetical protein
MNSSKIGIASAKRGRRTAQFSSPKNTFRRCSPKVVVRLSLREINCFTNSTYMPHYHGFFFFSFCFIFCKLYLPVLVNKASYFCLGRRLRSDGGASAERGKCRGVQQQKSLYPTWGTTFTPVGDIVTRCLQGGAAPVFRYQQSSVISVLKKFIHCTRQSLEIACHNNIVKWPCSTSLNCTSIGRPCYCNLNVLHATSQKVTNEKFALEAATEPTLQTIYYGRQHQMPWKNPHTDNERMN